MSELKEYIVTLHRHEDLEGFYEDMETPGGDLYIPDRKVEVSNRLDSSRNTHYLLTDEEVKILRNDSRVCGVTKIYSEKHYKKTLQPFGTITSTQWSKDYTTVNSGDLNWALLRCTEGTNRSNWGSDGTDTVTGTVTLTSTGKNVDIIILDTGHGNPNSPEFAMNPDGTGGSRYVQYNWFQHTDAVRGTSGNNGTYVYPTDSSGGSTSYGGFNSSSLSSSHGHSYHVSGIAAGNTQGWARDANIYGLAVSCTDAVGAVPPHLLFKYILEFHNNKGLNSLGFKNPTIVNNSWGILRYFLPTSLTKIHYRGSDYTSNISSEPDLEKYGIRRFLYGDAAILSADVSVEAQMEECIDAGIILVGAAGNDYYKIDTNVPGMPTTRDYYNKVYGSEYDYDIEGYVPGQESFYSRGTVAALSNCICVSNVANQVSQERAHRVQTGPRIDVFAPGVAINSTTHTLEYGAGFLISDVGGDTSTDTRSGGDYFVKLSLNGEGATSMSSPQVCGVLACLLEHYPRMNQQDCKDWIVNNATLNQIGGITADAADPIYTTPGDPNVNWLDDESLYGAENRYLYYKKQRETQGYVTAQLTNNVRKTSGMMFPRRRHI